MNSLMTHNPYSKRSIKAPKMFDDEIHVWITSIEQPDSVIQYLSGYLSTDELNRVCRYHFVEDRVRALISRGILRLILSCYLHSEPSEIRICENRYGKPYLPHNGDNLPLHFNLSHSDGMILLATTLGREIGVDVERIRRDFPIESIAKLVFSEEERRAIDLLGDHEKHDAFFACWTRKEAYTKARGDGLSLPLKQIEVSCKAGEPAALLNCHWDPSEVDRWDLTDVFVGKEYAAAVAVDGKELSYKYFEWEPKVCNRIFPMAEIRTLPSNADINSV
jgi:4'-phosphopantetheinyl transferase